MINEFPEQTSDLSKEELELIQSIIKGLKLRYGKETAITGAEICSKMNLNGARLRKMINHIRVNSLLHRLCGSKNGYFMANDSKELDDYIISFKQRIKSQVYVLNALEKQTIIFGGTGQTTLFE